MSFCYVSFLVSCFGGGGVVVFFFIFFGFDFWSGCCVCFVCCGVGFCVLLGVFVGGEGTGWGGCFVFFFFLCGFFFFSFFFGSQIEVD